jgi:DNA modification methylase
MNKQLLLGDCLEVLKTLPDNSVDSIVTDPPYHLTSIVKRFGKPGSAPAKDRDGLFKRQSKGFMGQEWDGGDIAFRTEVWEECWRVLKPGGHLLAFSASRNYHRMGVAIEDAGFEIRDQLMWIYGSGFPKSHNIGKSIDKKDNPEKWNNNEYGGGNYKCPNCDKWIMSGNPCKCPREVNEINNEWEGWGTALKPAHEPIVMARKPLSEKTVVDNVFKHGTGGINIDESRISTDDSLNGGAYSKETNKEKGSSYTLGITGKEYKQPEGRFPANIILSEEAAENLDGHQKDTSRYFYVVKPSKKEKTMGLEKNNHPTVKPIKLMEYIIKLVTPKGGTTLDPFMGSGTTGIAALTNGFNFIGIEMGEEYMDIAEQRINAWTKEIQTKLDI